MHSKKLPRLVIILFVVLGLVGLTAVNYNSVNSTSGSHVKSPGDIENYVKIDTKIPTPIGVYVSGQYGDSHGCGQCDGYLVEDYKAFRLGAFGVYFTLRIQ